MRHRPPGSVPSRYRLRVAWRDPRGRVRAPVYDGMVAACTLREAVGAVLGAAGPLLGEGTNLAWLTDREDNLVWTLAMDERDGIAP